MSMRDTLIKARALIAERGLTCGEFVTGGHINEVFDGRRELSPTDCFCTAGAIHYADGNFHNNAPVEYLGQFIDESFGFTRNDLTGRVYGFSDAHYQNPEIILALLDRAIEAAKLKEASDALEA